MNSSQYPAWDISGELQPGHYPPARTVGDYDRTPPHKLVTATDSDRNPQTLTG